MFPNVLTFYRENGQQRDPILNGIIPAYNKIEEALTEN